MTVTTYKFIPKIKSGKTGYIQAPRTHRGASLKNRFFVGIQVFKIES